MVVAAAVVAAVVVVVVVVVDRQTGEGRGKEGRLLRELYGG